MKKFVLLRHADALADKGGVGGYEDAKITNLGIKQTINASNEIKKHDIKTDIILTSPAIRAVDTAEVLSKELNIKFDIENSLEPFRHTTGIFNCLKDQLNTYDSIIAVGHNPQISTLASILFGKNIMLDNSDFLYLAFDDIAQLTLDNNASSIKEKHLFSQ